MAPKVKAETMKRPRQTPSIKYSGQWCFGAASIGFERGSGESIELDDVFDPSGTAEQEIAVGIHWKAPGDERLYRVRPALGESCEIANGIFKGVASGVDRAEDDLVFQNQIAHHQIRIDFDGSFSPRNAGENEDAVRPEVFHHFKRQARRSGCFVDE